MWCSTTRKCTISKCGMPGLASAPPTADRPGAPLRPGPTPPHCVSTDRALPSTFVMTRLPATLHSCRCDSAASRGGLVVRRTETHDKARNWATHVTQAKPGEGAHDATGEIAGTVDGGDSRLHSSHYRRRRR